MELLGASVEGNVDTVLHALRYDIAVERVEAPTAALEYARRLAQQGMPVNALVRAYRLGQRRSMSSFSPNCTQSDARTDEVGVIEAITATFSSTSTGCRSRSSPSMKTNANTGWKIKTACAPLRVREVLGQKDGDVDAATTSRYPLRWHHLGLVLWYPDVGAEGDELARLQRFLRELVESAGAAAAPIFVAADRTCGWGWLPYRAAAAEAPTKVRQFALAQPDSPSVAIGNDGRRRGRFSSVPPGGRDRPQRGGDSKRPEPTVISAADPGLSVVARLGDDVAATRDWVGLCSGIWRFITRTTGVCAKRCACSWV